MQLTILGRSGSFPAKDSACSGYLLQTPDAHILIDCGNGTLSRLQRYCDVRDISAILISHLHADHCGDLLLLRYGLETRQALGEEISPIPLYITATQSELLHELGLGSAFQINFINENRIIQIGDLSIGFYLTNHPIECYGIVVECSGKKIVYSADTSYNEKIILKSKKADLLLCEATFPEEPTVPFISKNHLTAIEAASIAKQAQVERLVLTHFWYQNDPNEILDRALSIFPNTTLAIEYETLDI